MLIAPIAHMEQIDRRTLNGALVEWGHKMGPWDRPSFREGWFHGLFQNGDLMAVVACGDLIREHVMTTAGPLDRAAAFELGRLCAARPHLCRAMLRLWREFVFPAICTVHGYSWVISYQDALLHRGDTYRFDGWVELGRSNSGTDRRSGRRGRRKVIWGWSSNPASMCQYRQPSAEELAR